MTWHKPGWLLLVAVLVLIPGAAVFGNYAIFHLFGNGSYLPYGSTGARVLSWWDADGHLFALSGRMIVVGGAAFVLLAANRVKPLVAAGLAAASSLASVVWLIAAVFVALAMAGPNALN